MLITLIYFVLIEERKSSASNCSGHIPIRVIKILEVSCSKVSEFRVAGAFTLSNDSMAVSLHEGDTGEFRSFAISCNSYILFPETNLTLLQVRKSRETARWESIEL